MSGSTGIRPLDQALSGLEQTINEWELEAEKPVYISLKQPSLNDLYKEKGEVYKILRCWRSGASALGKKQAVEECDRVIAFFERICGK